MKPTRTNIPFTDAVDREFVVIVDVGVVVVCPCTGIFTAIE